jgi:hypothetical protein
VKQLKEVIRGFTLTYKKLLNDKIAEGAIIKMKRLIGEFNHSALGVIGRNSSRTIDYIPILSVQIWI